MKDHFKLGVSTYYIPLHEMEEEIRELDRAGADIFHVDFFDGNFVENIGMSLQDLAFVRRCISSRKARTAGFAPTAEAAIPTSSVRMAVLTSSPFR